MVNSLH
jgi:hypothetical protein